ncbi:solute carrier organic anion transporter family member 4C1-like [Planococcus citri]|uniref:solute carrier organic anion transporter family member 4C1-like n=1 Tax=Planococcus citri TaxID=170843 RepID=UPI0031F89EEA
MKNAIDGNEEEKGRIILTDKSIPTEKNEENKFLSTNSEEQQNLLKSGIAFHRPNRLQVFSSYKWYICVYSLVSVADLTQSSYFFGTLSSIEKNFEMSATMLGILKSTFELGYLVTSISLGYFIGKGNKIRWISTALLISGIFSLVRIVPHFIDTKTLNKSQSSAHENSNGTWFETNFNLTMYSFYFFIVAQLMTGMGRAIVKNSGLTYLDHNTRKNSFPVLYAIVSTVGGLGRPLGYLISFYTLKVYVFPTESSNYTNKSHQWIGAWWLGWIPISVLCIVLSVMISLFPKRLAAAESKKMNVHPRNNNNEISVSDFYTSFKRVLGNKIAVLDILGAVAAQIAYSGYELFLPKYLESQYGLSASLSSFFLAVENLIEGSASKLLTGIGISRYKPKARTLIKYFIIVKFIEVCVQASFIFISCTQPKIQGNWVQDNSLNLTTECNINYACTQKMKHSPVCNVKYELLFYSSCHAGCSPTSNEQDSKVHINCSCVPDFGSVTEGLCPTDCKSAVILFLIVTAVLKSCLLNPIRFSHTVLRYRIADEEDKSLHYGIRKFFPALFGLLSSIIYGSLIDQSCVLFETTNHGRGHCLIYDLTKLRFVVHAFVIGGLIMNIILETFLWYYAKDLKMYDEELQMNKYKLQTLDKKM